MKLPCLALPCLALTIFLGGCSSSSGDSEDEALLVDRATGAVSNATALQEHDFGTVLAQGQVLRHEFTIKNPSDRAIRLVRGTAFTSCCSAVGPLPDLIPASGEVKIPVVLKAGFKSEPKRVEFAVETDDKDSPPYSLALRARFLSEWEIENGSESMPSLSLGQSGKHTLRLVARREGKMGRAFPEFLTATDGLTATFSGPGIESTPGNGLVESRRELEIGFPAAKQAGLRQGDVVLSWGDGKTEVTHVQWSVRPHLTVRPSGLVLKPSAKPVERTVVVESDGRPFRVTSVNSPALSKPPVPPRESSTSCQIPLVLDLSKIKPDGVVDVVFATDDPDQPTVALSVMLLRGSEEKAP